MTSRLLQRTPPPELVARVRLLCEQEGLTAAAKILGLSREPIARICGGLRVHTGTLALAAERVALLDARLADDLAAVDELAKRHGR